MLKFVWKVVRFLFLWGVLFTIVGGFTGIGVGLYVVKELSKDLPPIKEVTYKPALTSRVMDRNGTVLASLHEEEVRARLVPVSEIPKITRLAFVAVEDERFYDHYGIDPKAILRATLKNLMAGGVVEGGSTITQQLAKNRFLQPEKTLKRKVQEMILAVRLERELSKEEILGQYLNEIFFGKGRYGISSAAMFYFGKAVSDLTLAESAILAGLPKAPNRFSPFNGDDAYRSRQKIVLTKLWEQGYVTKGEAMAALAEPVQLASPNYKKEQKRQKAEYFMAAVKKELTDRFGVRRLFTGGLQVTTSLDWNMQQLAEKHFLEAAVFQDKPLETHPTLQGGLVVVDAASGDIRAMVGGRDFATSQYNRAVQARRQPGSAFKPFVYTTALLQGVQPNTIINDEPVKYENIDGERFWEPKNFGNKYHGPTILARAIANSYNVVAVKLLEKVGVSNCISLAKRMGITTPLDKSLPLALGSSDVSLMEMVSAYGVFANQGIRATPRFILRVEDSDGKLLYQAEPEEREVLDEETAFAMTQLLKGVVDHGSGRRARVAKHDVAGKTGTSSRFVDAWFVGFTPELAIGCYIGHDNRTSLGKGSVGGAVAAPIVGAFLNEYLKDRPVRKFRMPTTMDSVQICTDSGLLPYPDCKRRTELPFRKERAPLVQCNLHQPLDLDALKSAGGLDLPGAGGGTFTENPYGDSVPFQEVAGDGTVEYYEEPGLPGPRYIQDRAAPGGQVEMPGAEGGYEAYPRPGLNRSVPGGNRAVPGGAYRDGYSGTARSPGYYETMNSPGGRYEVAPDPREVYDPRQAYPPQQPPAEMRNSLPPGSPLPQPGNYYENAETYGTQTSYDEPSPFGYVEDPAGYGGYVVDPYAPSARDYPRERLIQEMGHGAPTGFDIPGQ